MACSRVSLLGVTSGYAKVKEPIIEFSDSNNILLMGVPAAYHSPPGLAKRDGLVLYRVYTQKKSTTQRRWENMDEVTYRPSYLDSRLENSEAHAIVLSEAHVGSEEKPRVVPMLRVFGVDPECPFLVHKTFDIVCLRPEREIARVYDRYTVGEGWSTNAKPLSYDVHSRRSAGALARNSAPVEPLRRLYVELCSLVQMAAEYEWFLCTRCKLWSKYPQPPNARRFWFMDLAAASVACEHCKGACVQMCWGCAAKMKDCACSRSKSRKYMDSTLHGQFSGLY